MGIFDKILGRDDETSATQGQAPDDVACPHTALTPHWDSLAEMGRPELATYRCESCAREFSAEEAKQYLDRPPEVLTAAAGDRDKS
jgi:hypothetical protein